ncbi:MAG: HutD family protein [Microbacterium enclense]
MPRVIRRFAEVTPAPWRNGRGQTWGLCEDSGDAWRLSVAQLTAPAVFSSFPGIRRTLVPWGGDIRLEIDGRVGDTRHGDAVRFSGEADTRLIALDQPCHAVNLLASGREPTLLTVAAGTRFDDETIVLVTETTERAARFDVIQLAPDEPLPSAGVAVRFDGE